jgi:autotransporter-associated beta strand protein
MLILSCSRRAGLLGLLSLVSFSLHTAQGGSATWDLNPTTGDWNAAANWTPMTVPNGPSDTATFDQTNETSVEVSAKTLIGSIVFTPQANAYTITVQPATVLTIAGMGIDNQSTVVPTLTEAPGPFGTSPGVLRFFGSASAGTAKVITAGGDDFAVGGATIFADTATAGDAVLITTGVQGVGGQPGVLIFQGDSNAGVSTITAEGGANSDGVIGAIVAFSQNANAGSATLTSEGAKVFGAFGSQIQFNGTSTAAQSTLIATGGLGIPGFIAFSGDSSGGVARLELFDGGGLAIDFHRLPGVTVGSIEGNGAVFLGRNILTVGSNDLTTSFSGVIEDGGAGGGLTKTGASSLTLRGSNSYGGSTTVRSGILFVDALQGSGTGDGPVIVAGGTLGGIGIIAGPVAVGTGSGQGAQLAAGSRHQPIGQLLIQGDLSFAADGTLVIQLDPQSATADQVTTNGVTISAGARIRLLARPGTLSLGASFVLIDNTSELPIVGTFSNLADGAIVTVNGNNLLASYSGSDGNDLTFTVVP